MNGDDEIKKLLKENVEVSKETLKILKGIRRSNQIAAVFRFFYWLIIVGGVIGAYYYLQPYVNQFLDLFKKIQEFMPK